MTRGEIITMAREAGITFKPMVIEGVEYGYRHVNFSDDIGGGDEAGCIERFAALVAATERQKHQADIELWKGEAAKAEKWRALALAKDGDGRTVQVLQAEARAEEREACAALMAEMRAKSRNHLFRSALEIAEREIRARGTPQPHGGRSIIETMAAELVAKEQAQASRIANRIAKGQCPDCDGEGEIGGQFCGGYQACEKCGGTGKSGGNP